MKKIVAVFLAVCMIELLTLPAYALDLENNKYILASEYKVLIQRYRKELSRTVIAFLKWDSIKSGYVLSK